MRGRSRVARRPCGLDFNELQSARGLVYADGVLLSNLLGSSYAYPPRWSLIPPDDIARGNVSIGGRNMTVAPNAFAPQRGDQENWLYALGLNGRLDSGWRLSGVVSEYDVSRDVQRSASTVQGGAGTLFQGDGTGWRTLDLKAEAPEVKGHTFTFGYHYDNYFLRNVTYNTADWLAGPTTSLSSVYRGDTRTQALFGQDAWRFAPGWLATLGLRYERWDAYGGALGNATGTLGYADRSANALSPKVALQWDATDVWRFRLSFATGTRFPTVGELFQGTISNNAIVNNNPNLRPEKAIDWDFTAERDVVVGVVRASVFQSDLRDSIYSQTTVSGATTVTNISTVDRVRVRGVELAFSGENVGLKGLAIDANVSASNAQILADAANPAYVGSRFPRIPRMRANLLASYRFDEHWLASVGVRYSGRQFNTLDNSDVNPDVYGGTSSLTVVDLKARYRFDRHWTASLGIDNLTDRRYYVFHPYPGRTFYGELKWSL